MWVREEFNDLSTPSKSSSKNSNSGKTQCYRCDGRGTIGKYANNTCTSFTHFPMTKCEPDNHGPKCFSIGAKTCPCCKGTGEY